MLYHQHQQLIYAILAWIIYETHVFIGQPPPASVPNFLSHPHLKQSGIGADDMFTTIQVSPNKSSTPMSPKPRRNVKSSRGIPVLACTECRRRKTRCDGEQPCQRCKDFAKDAPCVYVASKPRTISSQKYVYWRSSHCVFNVF